MSGKARGRLLLAAATWLVVQTATAQGNAEAFLAEAVQSDMAEVELGKLAQQKADDPELREYGSMLVSEHQAHMAKVRDLAAELGLRLPEEPTPAQQQTYERLARLSGVDFDRALVAHFAAEHRAAIEEYQVQTRAPDESVATLAKDTLPVLERHLAMAQRLQRGESVTQRPDDERQRRDGADLRGERDTDEHRSRQ
jgi:putative membrane protein